MGERAINPILNVYDNYRKVNILNSFWAAPSDPLVNTSGAGLWSNPATWSQGHVPLVTETAVLDGDVILDITTTIDKLVIPAGKTLTGDSTARTLTINTSTNVVGSINLSSAAHTIELKGTVNAIDKSNFIPGTLSTISYAALGNQDIIDLNYRHLRIAGTGMKTLTANTSLAGNLLNWTNNATSGLQLSTFNFTVNGTTLLEQPSILSKNSNLGTTIFVGNVNANGGGADRRFDLTGNPNIEFRGGLDTSQSPNNNFGTGTFSFTTNNQILNSKAVINYTFKTLVVGNITLTFTGGAYFLGTIDGTTAGSTFNNNGTVLLKHSTLPMTTGVFNHRNTTASSIGYLFNGNFTLPYTLYNTVYLDGTGTKTLSGNTVFNNTLNLSQYMGVATVLDLGTNNITVTGTTAIFQPGLIRRTSGTGTTLFIGKVSCYGGLTTFDFTSADIEFRGGLQVSQSNNITFGTGKLRFTTNNQTLNSEGGATAGINGNILAVGITLTLTTNFTLIGTLDGTVGSIVDCRGTFRYRNAIAPMATAGTLQTNAAANTFLYDAAINQDVRGGTYRTLTLSNNTSVGAVVKKLLGNVSVVNTYTLTAPATLDTNGFALTNP